MLVIIVVTSVLIGFIEPRQKFTLVGLAIGIVGVFVVMVQSRNVRESNLRSWFSENGFRRIEFDRAKNLFNTASTGTISYSIYQGFLPINKDNSPCILALRYSSRQNNNSVQMTLDFSYYFTKSANIDWLEENFKKVRNETLHTNLWKSQLRYFDLKDCEIFRPAIGGLVVSWRTPATVVGYTDRFQWIINALKN
ncbi:hypothetical protein GCM10028807_12340 [Spirosoma daeguense]